MALARWVAQSHDSLLRAAQLVELRQRSVAKWFRVECAATRGAKVRLLVKPTKATTDLLAAAKALCSDEHGVKRTANAEHLLHILRGDFHKRDLPPNDPSSATGPAARVVRKEDVR